MTNIDTYHEPVTSTIQIKLTGQRQEGKGRTGYQTCAIKQQAAANKSSEDSGT